MVCFVGPVVAEALVRKGDSNLRKRWWGHDSEVSKQIHLSENKIRAGKGENI